MWILFITALCCLYLYTWIRFYPGKFPVYPGGVPLLGNISLFSGGTEKEWENIKKIFKFSLENGDIVLIYFGPIPIYIITDPDDCNTVLTSCMHRSGIAKKFGKSFLGNGLLFGPGTCLSRLVLRRKRESQDKEQNQKSDTKFKPFLDRLLESSDTLSTQDLRDEINTTILAGFETTSATLCHCLLLLGTHNNIQEKCYQEINEVFGDSERDVTKDDLPRLKYIEMVLKETMRLCPVVPYTTRIITEDVQLIQENAVLRKGHLCFVALYGVMHHPTWGPDVEQFVPERWLDSSDLNPNAFGAFGYGRRNCVGRVYAMMSMKVAMVHILRAYRVSGEYHRMRIKNMGINKPVDGHHITLYNR
ncbi:unnamed protein product [Pieris brassicae]|uniref:Cytochrome P450 n=1 Tax=Pieris brassicae TaxID=7116 RepID=A0A9P0TVJ1_PIEBR|nr:unnamed protein product [Pieris brassicae]